MSSTGIMDANLPGVYLRDPLGTRGDAELEFDSILDRLNTGKVSLHVKNRTVGHYMHNHHQKIVFKLKDNLPQMDIDYTSVYIRDDVEFIVFREHDRADTGFALLWEDTCIIIDARGLVNWLSSSTKRYTFKKKQVVLINDVAERLLKRLEVLAL